MFKENYLNYVRTELLNLLPDGYSVKVVEEQGYGAKASPKFEIVVYVKFGVGSKQTNSSNRITQPVILTVKSEGGDFRIANGMLNDFFLLNSKTHSTTTIDNAVYDLWHNYNTPVIQTGIEQIGTYQRTTILLTGVITYSKGLNVGVKYYLKSYEALDYQELAVINPQSQFNTQSLTPQYVNEEEGKHEIEGANNIITFMMLANQDALSNEFIETSFIGTPRVYMLKVEYSATHFYEIKCKPTAIANSHDTASGDNILTITLGSVR